MNGKVEGLVFILVYLAKHDLLNRFTIFYNEIIYYFHEVTEVRAFFIDVVAEVFTDLLVHFPFVKRVFLWVSASQDGRCRALIVGKVLPVFMP